jgi:pilus assembly protein CpaC
MKPRRGSAPKIVALFVYIIVILVAAPQAQQPVSFSGSPGAITAGPAAATPEATDIDLLVGRSTILNVGAPIARVSLTVPDVADAMVTAPQQLLIHGKTPGTISLFVWDRAGGIKTYEVNVRRDIKQLSEQLQQLFPGETITVAGSAKDVVLSGTVSTKYVIDKAGEVAAGFVEKKENVVNLLKQQEGVASNQVMLRVRFAEVSRSALQELGASYIANGYKNDWYGRATTQQFAAPDFDSNKTGGLTFSDFLNIFVFNTKHNIGAVVRALQTKGLFQSLAEPNLIATNGKEASFLAGGEYPYPVAQATTGGTSITIQFKEFGVRLTFTPTVLSGDLINLKVKPEVSALDFANGVNISGFRVPALSTRRTETEVELQDGQTFAVAGLMNNVVTSTMSKIPGIGDVPVLGYLFRSKAYQKQQTELVVMITPTIVRRGSPGVSQGLPSAIEPYLGAPSKPLPQPSAYTGSPRYPASGQSQPRTSNDAPATSTPAASPATSPASGVAVPQARPSAPVNAVPAPSTTTTTQPSAAPRVPSTTPQSQAMPQPQATSQSSAPQVIAHTPTVRPQAPAVVKAQPQPVEHKAAAVDHKTLEADKKRLEEAQKAKAEQDRKNAEVKKAADIASAREHAIAAKKASEEKAAADKKASEEQARQQKLDEERAKREAVVAKRNAEADRKKLDEQKKREKSLSEAAERLRQAQAAYQAEMEKAATTKGNANDKPKGGVQ